MIFLIALVIYGRDPYRTKLPFGSTDLSSVEKQLARLSPEDRKLVEDYVKRSKGDVLPAAWADPDDPLTARTFGQAIELERKWNEKMVVNKVLQDQWNAERQARLQPLRAIVQASVASAEILTKNEYQALVNPSFYQHSYQVDKTPVFVTHILIQNLSEEAVKEFTGSLKAHDSQQLLPLNICWIDHKQELAPDSEIETICGSTLNASVQEQAFVTDTKERFEVFWEPRHIKLANGREFDSGL